MASNFFSYSASPQRLGDLAFIFTKYEGREAGVSRNLPHFRGEYFGILRNSWCRALGILRARELYFVWQLVVLGVGEPYL